jgi:hypothetical protein
MLDVHLFVHTEKWPDRSSAFHCSQRSEGPGRDVTSVVIKAAENEEQASRRGEAVEFSRRRDRADHQPREVGPNASVRTEDEEIDQVAWMQVESDKTQ